MIRAIFFDFYSVWTPDKIGYYLAYAELISPSVYKELFDASEKYYQGDLSLDDLTGTFRYKLGATDIDQTSFKLNAKAISPEIANFMKSLHGHFVKVGVLANLGPQEYEVLKQFNDANEIIEAVISPYSLDLKLPLLDMEVFSRATSAIGEDAASSLYISGNPYHLAFAKAMSMQTLQYEGLKQLESTMDQLLVQDTPK
jgi:FMN phosphatase YigB (HAD superfamily)